MNPVTYSVKVCLREWKLLWQYSIAFFQAFYFSILIASLIHVNIVRVRERKIYGIISEDQVKMYSWK